MKAPPKCARPRAQQSQEWKVAGDFDALETFDLAAPEDERISLPSPVWRYWQDVPNQ